jgi:endoglucanase
MKKIISLLISAGLLNTAFAQPVQEHGQLQVKGTQLVDKNSQPVVLHGMSFGWSCFHPRFYTAGAVHTLVNDWKSTVIRAAMGIEPEKGYKEDSATNMRLVQTVIDACIKEGVYVIIDWHSHNINLKEARAFFKTMATTYHGYPNIIYEVFNEPDYETWPEVKAYATEIIAAIRAIDANNIILVGSPRWDQDVQLPAADPIKGYSNLMYTMHFYAGTHKQWLRDRTDEAIKKGLPIFVSECAGMEATGDGPIDNAEWKRFIDWMAERKISWATWSVSDKDETCSVLNTSASSDGGWSDKDIKESGLKVREYLRKAKELEK